MNRPINPFDDDQGRYIVLVNDSGQYSLWPAGLSVPSGWMTAHDEATRATCLAYIERHWTPLRAGRPQPGTGTGPEARLSERPS